MTKLLNDEELHEAIRNIEGFKTQEDGTVSADYDLTRSHRERVDAFFSLFQEQKQAHGNMVIGEDESTKNPFDALRDHKVLRNSLRAEQRLRNQTGDNHER